MRYSVFVIAVLALLVGCAEKKADVEKLNHANALVNTAQFEEGIKQLEEIQKKSPSDPALQQSLVSAYIKFGHFYLYNDTLSPKVKYPSALKNYRSALKIDPNNKDAQENANQIIEIYKMMGREVPNV
jgi:tetratricopeptide (TPR) repeat protein